LRNKIEVSKYHDDVHERGWPKGYTGPSSGSEMVLQMRENVHIGMEFWGVDLRTPRWVENGSRMAQGWLKVLAADAQDLEGFEE
jgi:hypothetical protein